MCQSVRDGGRRCPVHRHTSHAVITATIHGTGLNRHQAERLFAELRREGRASRRLSERQRNNIRTSVLEAVEGNETLTANVENQLTLGQEHDGDMDGATGYALRLLQARAAERTEALENRFREVAERNGLTVEQVRNTYENLLASSSRERGAEYPEEYNQNTRRRAVLANLPYDVASVVALERLDRIGQSERRRRVQLVEAPASSHLHAFGYNNGRLEVMFNNDETVYAYNNVPEEVWERLSSSERPGSVYARSIRGNSDYFYASADEAESDGYVSRCMACGQFASASGHSCPPRALREELESENTPEEVIRQELVNNASTPEELEAAEATVSVPDEIVTIENETTILPADETEVEAAAEEPVAEETPATVAAAHISPETFSYTDRTPTDIGDAQFPGFIGADVYAAMAPAEPTAEEQFAPTAMEASDYVVFEANGLSNVALVSKNTMYRLNPSYQHMQISDEEREMITNAPDDIYFVVARDSEVAEPNQVRIIASYDSALFTGGTTREWENGALIRTVKISRRGIAVAGPSEDESMEQRLANINEAENVVNQLVDNGDAVRVTGVSSMTRRNRFDGSLHNSHQPRVATGRVTEMRRALRENKVAVVPVKIEQSSYTRTGGDDSQQRVDDQGFSVSSSQNYNITGNVAVRRGANGTIEVISSQRTLKCSCYDYRRSYYCEHLNYANRHISNVIAQQVLVTANANSEGQQFARGGLLTATLARRDDVSVVEATTNDNNEEIPAYISFGSELTASRPSTYENRWAMSSRLVAPAHLRNLEEPTFAQLREMSEIITMKSKIRYVSVPVQPGSLRMAIKRGDTEVPVKTEFGYDAAVSGSIIYKKTDDIENAEVRERKLKCTCAKYRETYDCEHVRFVAGQPALILNAKSRNGDPSEENSLTTMYNRHIDSVRNEEQVIAMMNDNPRMRESTARRRVAEEIRLAEERRRREEEERRRRIEREQAARIERARAEAERVNRANAAYVAATDTYRANMMERWNNVEGTLYSDTENNKFYEDYRAALRRKAAGEDPIPFRTENVTDGICAPVEGARRFGVEIEFDIQDGVNRRQALEKIGQELQEAGLTSTSYQRGYHSAAASGWNEWSFENDCTVAGEIVSPIMSDTPEHWEQLRKVCEIVNRNGGVASTRAGSHVHISTGSYGLSTAKHAELVRQTNKNEDILYRMATNPSRGRHRGTQWCSPNANDNNGDISAELMEGHNVLSNVRGNNHGTGMNFGGASSNQYSRNHVEFRMWDGSLDPAVIQQQVVMSAAITDLAERNVIENNGSTFPTEERRRIGNKRQAERSLIGDRGTHNEETFRQINHSAAEFIDSIVRTSQQREDLASLFAITKWQSS